MSDRQLKQRFGHRVREQRLARHVSQEEFADQCGMHRTYIGGIERGERNPTLTVISRIARTLGVPPGKLLDCEDAHDRV